MKFRKAMTALAMSSAMVMAVPGVLEAKTTSFEDEGVVYYKVEQDGTVKSIAEEDYEAARKEAGSQEQETEVDVSDESSYSGIIFNGEADGSWYISEDDDRVVMSGGKASVGETTEEDTTVMTQGGENESGAVYFQSVENSADAYGTYGTKEEAKRIKEYGKPGLRRTTMEAGCGKVKKCASCLMTTAVFTCRMQIRKRKTGCISTWSAMKAERSKR